MPNAIWRGAISFGLVTIPVSLQSAVAPKELSFRLLDKRDLSPVHNKRVNASGREVAWEQVVKGIEIDGGRWITLTDDEFRAANVRATQTIDIVSAVCADEVPLAYFDTPYRLVPDAPGTKAYALLRESLRTAQRIALGRIVIRTRQRLCALVPDGDVLSLEVLRWPYELKSAEGLPVPTGDLARLGVTDAELALARQLVAAIEAPWEPESYVDSYHDDVLDLIRKKAEGGSAAVPAAPVEPEPGNVVDIVELLKRSVEDARRSRASG